MSRVRIDITVQMANGRSIVHNSYPPIAIVDDTERIASYIQRIVDCIRPGAQFSVSNSVIEGGVI